ncbi:MAG: hypothetical protein U1E05_05485 [Patescibacteria group bacterium]|nr:hypothetical protein [Patescibacteria group bacterium]
MRPPLAKQYDRLCAAVYLFYVETGELPNAADLSEPFQELIAEDNGITYTRQDGAAYRLERPYPLNIPMVGLVTFGQFWGGEGVVIAWKQRPNDIVYNANPRARR